MSEKKKPQLHEVLAVENDLKNAAKKIIEETTKVFKEKPNLFIGVERRLKMNEESRVNEEEAQFQYTKLETTVNEKLKYTCASIVKAINATMQKECTNQNAKADIIVDGNTLIKNVPATMLLSLEKELQSIRNLYNQIPTLQISLDWEKDVNSGNDIYKLSKPEVTNRTEKKLKHQIIVPGTKEHPAQVEKWTVDEVIGKYTKTIKCGMLTSARKSILIGRIDKLIRAVKKARTRANQEEVKKVTIGKELLGFINA